jgi:hypothetical protein
MNDMYEINPYVASNSVSGLTLAGDGHGDNPVGHKHSFWMNDIERFACGHGDAKWPKRPALQNVYKFSSSHVALDQSKLLPGGGLKKLDALYLFDPKPNNVVHRWRRLMGVRNSDIDVVFGDENQPWMQNVVDFVIHGLDTEWPEWALPL